MSTDSHLQGTNRLLAMLPDAAYEHLRPSLELVELSFKQVLYEPDTPIPYVYFPLLGVVSLLTVMEDGTAIEFATVGNEGMVGLPLFMNGSDLIAGKAIVQVPGKALRMQAAVFKEEVSSRSSPLSNVLLIYMQPLFAFIAQSVACNRVHSIRQRCARWLLTTQDRVESEQFLLTQEFLAEMLGVRRAGVNEVASQLQEDGLIRYNRGVIMIVDRQGLEAASCECYRITKEEYRRALG